MRFGIDLGGSHIALGLVNDNCEIIEKKTYYMNDRGNEVLENYIVRCIVSGIDEILKTTNYQLQNVESIGIATPGNPQDGCIKNVVNLGISKFNIEEKLKQSFAEQGSDVRINLENDGKCAGLAEKHYGALKEYNDCVFLCIGTGIGGAAFIDNKFIKPRRNSGFEFGHMIIKKGGERCNCGSNGCFEVYCSKKRLKNKMKEYLGIKEYISAKELTQKVNENISNPNISNLLNEYIENLTIGISNIINILEPEAICLGGSISHYEELIIENLRKKINSGKYLFNKENPPKILTAQAENDAGIIGATLI